MRLFEKHTSVKCTFNTFNTPSLFHSNIFENESNNKKDIASEIYDMESI